MQKILLVISLTCISLCCYSMNIEDSFLKVANNVYVQYHREFAPNNKNVQIGHFTPTCIKTYGGTAPESVWNMQTINYMSGSVCLFKDGDNNCCIDIYESPSNLNKCRILGTDGRDIYTKSGCFSVYEVAEKGHSFVNNEPRRIFVDTTGLYIVLAKYHPMNVIIKAYEQTRAFEFQKPVIKISAIYKERMINETPITSDFFIDENYLAQSSSPDGREKLSDSRFCLNCSRNTPMFVGSQFSPVTKLYPAMQQIEKIADVKLTSCPPSEKSVIKRMSDILGLNIIAEMLTVRDGKIYLMDMACAALSGEIPGIFWSIKEATSFYNYAYSLQEYIPLLSDQSIQWRNHSRACLNVDIFVKNSMLKEYVFDASAKAVVERQRIGIRKWDNI